ncbi:MAG: hypothetical protein ABWU13_15650 [Limnospira maxima]|uniref:Uncharacterized protein n=1 Tax=Limnospira indica PCC 8005 TaxID=376219 RepID=A0A9P1KL83_9CYAN|nr:protein of unknown function [Limnospira indica PCC 8005]
MGIFESKCEAIASILLKKRSPATPNPKTQIDSIVSQSSLK